jgi:hypothetical protein
MPNARTGERASLVAERGRIANRMKATLARLGIRGFKPTLKKAAECLETLCTPEGESVPPNTLAELRRAMARLRVVTSQIDEIERARLERLEQAPEKGPPAMVRLLAQVIGIGIETADMLVQEVLSRNLRDRRAVARYAGLTGAPDESGSRRREKGLARAGNARVRRGMIQLAWRFLMFQKDSALAELPPVSVDTTLSEQEPRGAEGWTKRSKERMWRLGLWAARASSGRPRCPQPGMTRASRRWRLVSDGALRASAMSCCG